MAPRIQPIDNVDNDHPNRMTGEGEDAAKFTELMYQTYEERWSEASIRTVVQRWTLSPSEVQQLRELQRRLGDLNHWKNNPQLVVCYLRGPGKCEEVEGKIREMIQWRLDFGADRLLEEYRPPRALLYYVPSAILQGYDKDGDPIYLERGGAMDGVGLQRYSREDIVKHVCWLREIGTRGPWIQDYQREMGRPPSQVTIIYDMEGMSARHLKRGVIPMFQDIVKINQQRYCGLAKRIILLRAPSIFNFIWSMAKHFFPPEGQRLMVFTGPSNYMKVLDKYIDREVLPPCICKEGKGSAIDCMPQNFEGGILPPNAEASIPDEPWITIMLNMPKTMQRREQEGRKSTPTKEQPRQRPSKLPPVCLSEYRDVQILTVPQPHWQDEFETVLVR